MVYDDLIALSTGQAIKTLITFNMSETNANPPPDSSSRGDLLSKETTAQLSAIAALAAIKESPAVAEQFSRELIKSPEFSRIFTRRIKGPYYNAIRAMELKPILDDMIKNHKPKLFYVRRFHVDINTLRNRIFQSFQFLVQDPDMLKEYGTTYKNLYEQVRIARENKGTAEALISVRFYTDTFVPLEAETGVEKKDINNWKQEVDKYLEDNSKLEPLHLTHLTLSDKEVEDLDLSLGQLEGILANVSNSTIHIIKFNPNKEQSQ